MTDHIVGQLAANGIQIVNFEGDESLLTNSTDPCATTPPCTIEHLTWAGLRGGLTTVGINLNDLERHFPEMVLQLSAVDSSFDSPFTRKYNLNRGASLLNQVLQTIEITQSRGIPHTIIVLMMAWSFTPRHLDALVKLAWQYGVHLRIGRPKEACAA